jgi:hypothetical protein
MSQEDSKRPKDKLTKKVESEFGGKQKQQRMPKQKRGNISTGNP